MTYKYTFENPNQASQALSWLLLNKFQHEAKKEKTVAQRVARYHDLSRDVVFNINSILTEVEVPEFETTEKNWYMDFPVWFDESSIAVVWRAEQVGSFGSYFTALMKDQAKPDQLYYLSAPDEDRMISLVRAVTDFIDKGQPAEIKRLLKIEEFTGETAPIDKRLFKISFKRGLDYGDE